MMVFLGATLPVEYAHLKVGPLGRARGAAEGRRGGRIGRLHSKAYTVAHHLQNGRSDIAGCGAEPREKI